MLWLLRAVPPSGQMELALIPQLRETEKRRETHPRAAHSLPLGFYNPILSSIAIPAASRLETGLDRRRKGCLIRMVGQSRERKWCAE